MPHRHAKLRYPALQALVGLFACLDETWSRRRVWGAMQAFAGVFVMVMPGRAGSYEQACGTLFDWAGMRFGWQSAPDPAGFSRARKRLTVSECLKVFTLASGWAAKNLQHVAGPVAGRPLVAVDGTILHLPRAKGLVKRFGVPTDSLGIKELAHYPQSMLVSAWDVVRRVPLAWRLTPHAVGERTTFLAMLKHLPTEAVLLLDRGYPSHEVLEAIVASGRDVVMRMVASEIGGSWKPVEDFLASKARRAVVEIPCGKGRKAKSVKVLTAANDAVKPALCFIEIGPLNSSVAQADRDRVAALVTEATSRTSLSAYPPTSPTPRTLVYDGDYVDAPLMLLAGSGATAKRYFIHANHLYSPLVITDSSGNAVERYSYTAYGQRTIFAPNGAALGHSTVGQERGFTGYQLDEEAGIYYARARMYSPALGRFVSRDPAGYVDGYGLYSGYFVPNHTDYSGRECDEIDWAGRQCPPKSMRSVRLYIIPGEGKMDSGHAWLAVEGKEYGFYPASSFGSRSYAVNAYRNDTVVPGIVKDDRTATPLWERVQGNAFVITFMACSSTRGILLAEIAAHTEDEYGLSNKNARNFIGWALSGLTAAGFTVYYNQSERGLRPSDITGGDPVKTPGIPELIVGKKSAPRQVKR